jgi:hypothetical protein
MKYVQRYAGLLPAFAALGLAVWWGAGWIAMAYAFCGGHLLSGVLHYNLSLNYHKRVLLRLRELEQINQDLSRLNGEMLEALRAVSKGATVEISEYEVPSRDKFH